MATFEEIFLAAVELPPERRASYLDDACGDDPCLRAQVEALLRSHEAAGGMLDQPLFGPGQTVDESSASARSNVVIGPYRLIEQIGEGGMGTVWMARQTSPVKRLVALKLIKAGMDTRQVISRFEAERQALALMDHPNIAKVLDGGTTGGPRGAGRPYFVMELVKGIPITRFCDEHQLTPRERLEVFIPICQAIQHAHQKGIIHRDLKPTNVLVALYDGKPVPKVIDFGVAKATGPPLTDRTLVTGFGAIVGTPEYMSPEQAEINQIDVDTRSDIYALGVLLYELLAGSPPFSGKELERAGMVEMLRVIREQEPQKPSTKLSSAAGLPTLAANRGTEPAKLTKLLRGDLDWIVMKALEKDRDRRYETANSFALDLRRYLADEPVLARPPSAAYRLRKLARRHRAGFAVAALLLVTLLSATILVSWKWWETEAARKRERIARDQAVHALAIATTAEEHAREGRKRAVRAQREARLREAEALVGQARSIRRGGHRGQRFDALKAVRDAVAIGRELGQPPNWFDPLRTEAIACLALPDVRTNREWDGWPADSTHVQFDSKLERYARVDRHGDIHLHRVADGAEVLRLPGIGKGEVWTVFSPDDDYLVVYSLDRRITLWKLSAPAPVAILEGLTVNAAAFSPDGRHFAIAPPDGAVRIHDLPNAERARALEGLTVRASTWYEGLAFDPTGTNLAIADTRSVRVYDLAANKLHVELPQSTSTPIIAWRPDGKALAILGPGRTIFIWDVEHPRIIAQLVGHKNDGIGFVFDHAGDLLVSRSWGGVLHLWDPLSGRQLFNTRASFDGFNFSPDDRFFAAEIAGPKLAIWELTTPSAYHTLTPVRDVDPRRLSSPYACAIRQDQRLLVVAEEAGIAFWDLPRRKQLAFAPIEYAVVVFQSADSLLTSGVSGLLRWPIQEDATTPGRLRVGPPTRLLPPVTSSDTVACSKDGRVIACPHQTGPFVLHPDHPEGPIELKGHWDVRFISVSPDGRRVATGSHHGTKVKIWDARTGTLERELPIETASLVGFSPDGKWLATSGGGLTLWRVGSWDIAQHLGNAGTFAFAPDGRYLAVESGQGWVRLIDPESGREITRLEQPIQHRAQGICISGDGSQLIATSRDSGLTHVWDLHAVRRELKTLGLDWDAPPFPPEPTVETQPPMELTIDLGDLASGPPGSN